MKPSRYNVFFEENSSHFVFNQLTSSILEVDSDTYEELQNGTLDFENLEEEEKLTFINGNILTNCDNEQDIILFRNKNLRFNNKIARITIMPTLECNFSCWYCYEEHIQGRMSQEMADLVYLAIEKIIMQNQLSLFILDWFGGEPLMCFEEIVYPLSLKIKNKCIERGVRFSNNITTNGYVINSNMIKLMNEISLNSFQITLDGEKEIHNKSRFTNSDSNTYDLIINNIKDLCERMDNIHMTLRINYTPDNINGIHKIIESFPKEIRNKIQIFPQKIWQTKKDINYVDNVTFLKLEDFENKGYRIDSSFIEGGRGISCYTENRLQFVINFDGKVFKCTARDFATGETSIGHINDKGNFIPNSYYYRYFTSSGFENDKCLKCEYLPSCLGICIQKKIEGDKSNCPKNSIKESLYNQLKLRVMNFAKQESINKEVAI